MRVPYLIHQNRDILGSEHVAVRDVGEIGEGDLVTAEVLLLGENVLITDHLALEGCHHLGDTGLVSFARPIAAIAQFGDAILVNVESGRRTCARAHPK